MSEKTRRAGRFHVDKKLLDSDIEQLSELLIHIKFVPYRAELLYYMDAMEYVGYSPLFDSVPMGQEVPTYTLKIRTETNKETMEETIVEVEVEKL